MRFPIGLAAAVVLAGCIAPPAEDVPLSAQEAVVDTAVATLTWEGHIVVGAAGEALAHFTPSDQLIAPIWKSGFVIDLVEVPQVLEVQLDWTSATPTLMNFMLHSPHGTEREGEEGWPEYTTDYPGVAEGPLCIRIPPSDLVAGHWYPMAHSASGADIRLLFTVRTVGGAAAIGTDHPHGHETNPEEIQNGVETDLEEDRAWEPCALGESPER